DDARGGLVALRPLLVAGGRGGRVVRAAARRRQRAGAADALGNRSTDQIPGYIERVKAGEFRLMGFGHRIYKSFDPRAEIIKKVAYDVFEVTGPSELLDIALELERIALEDEYFISHKLYPNVDFYSGIIYLA